jgi:hypothetical protein
MKRGWQRSFRSGSVPAAAASTPRGVKRKMSNYPLRPPKRRPTRRIDYCKLIRIVK